MTQPSGKQLAAVYVGCLSVLTDDPRLAGTDSEHAFGWTYLKEAQLWKTHGCAQGTAE